MLNFIKVFSMLLTTLFGILGTFKDYAADKGSVRWKRITIAGILISGATGMITQEMEYKNSVADQIKRDGQVSQTAQTLATITTAATASQLAATASQNAATQGLAATSVIQSGVATTAGELQTVQKGLSETLKQQTDLASGQSRVLTSEGQALASISQIVNPLSPVALGISVEIDAKNAPCLQQFAAGLRTRLIQQGKIAPGFDPKTKFDTLITTDAAKKLSYIDFRRNSPLFPPESDPASIIATLTGAVRFQKPAQTGPAGKSVPGDAVQYDVDFSTRPPDMNGLEGAIAAYISTLETTFYYRDNVLEFVDLSWQAANLRPDDDLNSLRSVGDLPGTNLTITFSKADSCPLPLKLQEFYLGWGQNYTFVTLLSADGFKIAADPNAGTTFSRTVTRTDLGFPPNP